MRKYILFIYMLTCAIGANAAVDLVLVNKSERKMYLMEGEHILKEYRVAFGQNPKGHKEKEGDEKTPEGIYQLDFINEKSNFYRSMHINYPNQADRERAEKGGYSPGGAIMVHGQKKGFGWISTFTQYFNWTDGCIALKNSEMDEFLDLVSINTNIEIIP